MLNSIYGQVSPTMGLNTKARGGTLSFFPGDLTNPVVAAHCTAMVRAVFTRLAEQIYAVEDRGGRVISCTTDGFITDLNPTDYGLHSHQGKYGSLFSATRTSLWFDASIMETKGVTAGLAS